MARKKVKAKVKYDVKPYAKLENNFTQVSNDVIKVTENAYQLAIYVYLCRHYNTTYKYAFPSLSKIATEVGVSISTVQKTLNELEQLKLIKKLKYDNRTSEEFANNCYYIFYPIVKEVKTVMPTLTEEQLKEIEEFENTTMTTETEIEIIEIEPLEDSDNYEEF